MSAEIHPLSSKWKFWITTISFEAKKKYIYTQIGPEFSTVEDFFKMYKTIVNQIPVETIKNGGVSLFKDNIEPKTEDTRNKFRYRLSFDTNVTQEDFLELFLFSISGKVQGINGVYTNVNPQVQYRILVTEFWTSDKIDLTLLNETFKCQIKEIFIKNA